MFEDYSTSARGTNQTYLVITLEDVLVSSYQIGGQGGGQNFPTESISLNFAKIEFKYVGETPTPDNKFSWDQATNKGA